MKNVMFKPTLIAMLISLLSGCSSQYTAKKPQQDALQGMPVNWQESTTVNLSEQAPITVNMDSLFQQPQLKALIAEAVTNNPDLNELALKIKASGALLQQMNGKRYPTVDLALNTTRQKQAGGINTNYQYGLNVSWEADLWGSIADKRSAANADFTASQWEYQVAKRAVAARLARLWIEGWALNQTQQNAHNYLDKLLQVEAVILENYRNGTTQLEDLSSTRQQQESTKADMLATAAKINKNYRKMALLLGRMPSHSALFDNNLLPEIAPPPVLVPAVVLARRPDIQVAFYRLQGLDAQTRSAYKALIPSLTLSGNLNKVSRSGALQKLFSGDTVWSLVGGITQPIFNAGSIKASADASAYQAEGAWWQYRNTLLKAVFEVESALAMERSLTLQIQRLINAQEQSSKVQQIYKDKYINGSVDIVSLIETQLKKFEVDARVIQTKAAQMDNRMLLALAMGFGLQQTEKGKKTHD